MTVKELKKGLKTEGKKSTQHIINPLWINPQMAALNLLSRRIPEEVLGGIIQGATHDKIFLPDAEVAAEYLLPEDLPLLRWCGVGYDDKNECLYMFV